MKRQLTARNLVTVSALALLAVAFFAVLAASAGAAPTVAITSPSNLDVIASGTVPITLDITNFTLNGSAVGSPPVAGEGHYHLMLDGVYQRYDFRTATFLADVPDGVHTIRVELANNDHTLLGINSSVTITISPGSPRVRISAPSWGALVNSSSVELVMSHENLTYDPAAVGGANQAGSGHYHVLVDGGYHWYGTEDFFNVSELLVGTTHWIRVEFHNNDHSLLTPIVYDEIYVNIPAGAPELRIDPNLFGATVNATSVEVAMTILNFTIDPAAVGFPPVPGRGHYHAWLDGVFLGPAAENPLLLSDLAQGNHTLYIELRNNNHAVLTPRVVSWTHFNIPSGAPRVNITSPTSPIVINASSVRLTFTVTNFTLDAAAIGSPNNLAGVGHWHAYVDGVYWTAGAGLSIVIPRLSEGPHVLTIELHNNDHSDLTWPAFDVVRVAVQTGAPRVAITTPASTAGAPLSLRSSSVTLQFAVTNLVLDAAAIGGTNVAGRGHWHLLLDGVYVTAGAGTTASLTRLTPGVHEITIELHNNDHSALTWPAADILYVNVPADASSIRIASPAGAAEIPLNWSTVSVSVTNFLLQPGKIGSAAVPGEGHWHLFLDGAYQSAVGVASATVIDLSPGTHTIRVELRNNDHVPLSPAVWDEITVTSLGKKPAIKLVTPAQEAILWGNATLVTVEIVNLTLAPNSVGAPAVNGEGHYHVFVDSVYRDFSAATTYTLAGLPPGDHWINVSLANNDHTALGVPQQASALVHIAKLPGISLTAPLNNTETTSQSVTITVSITNFTLAPDKIGKAAEAGVGHYHIFVDGTYIGASASGFFNVTNLTLGTHVISVRPFNNNHTEIPGAPTAYTTVTVKAAPPPTPGFLPGFGAVEAMVAAAGLALAAAFVRRRRR